ncbi:hypothetical protein BDW75DRAFT_222217 [Aspergillus navahoensis]
MWSSQCLLMVLRLGEICFCTSLGAFKTSRDHSIYPQRLALHVLGGIGTVGAQWAIHLGGTNCGAYILVDGWIEEGSVKVHDLKNA